MCEYTSKKLALLQEMVKQGGDSLLGWRKKILSEFLNSETGDFSSARKFELLNTTVLEGNNETLSSLVGEEVSDKYIANLSLHLVNDPDAMLREAFKVLRKGGRAAFSVMGKIDQTCFFAVADKVKAKYGVKPSNERPPWHLNDREALVLRVEAAGFTDVVAWF